MARAGSNPKIMAMLTVRACRQAPRHGSPKAFTAPSLREVRRALRVMKHHQ